MMQAAQDLERRCRQLVHSLDAKSDPTDSVVEEVALTLDQIDDVRRQEKRLRDRLSDRELDLKSKIMNLKTPLLEYDWDKWARRKQMVHGLEKNLSGIEQQVQRLAVDRESKIHGLLDRLWGLWKMRDQLGDGEPQQNQIDVA